MLLINTTQTNSNATYNGPGLFARSFGFVLILLSTFVGISFNLLLLVIILSKKSLRRNQINIFLASLILDTTLAIASGGVSMTFVYAFGEWKGPILICKAIDWTLSIFLSSVVWHYAFICLHRYLFLVYTSYRSSFQLNKRRKFMICSLIASRLIPFISALPILTFTNGIIFSETKLRCEINNEKRITQLVILTVNNLVPVFIISFCFIRTFMLINKSSKATDKCMMDACDAQLVIAKYQHEVSPNEFKLKKAQTNRNKQRRSMNKMFALLLLLLLLGFMPYRILRLSIRDKYINPDYIVFFTIWISLISPLSPIVILLVNLEIYKQFKVVLSEIKDRVVGICLWFES